MRRSSRWRLHARLHLQIGAVKWRSAMGVEPDLHCYVADPVHGMGFGIRIPRAIYARFRCKNRPWDVPRAVYARFSCKNRPWDFGCGSHGPFMHDFRAKTVRGIFAADPTGRLCTIFL
jgi:hypothetical protein